MKRDYRKERNGLIGRYYGASPPSRSRRPRRNQKDEENVAPEDGYGLPAPVNSPYPLYGHCIAWAYSLNGDGYGTVPVHGHSELVHRMSYRQTRGSIPEGKQINHLCDRPYCFQPAHLYAGNQQDNSDDSSAFKSDAMISAFDVAMMWQSSDEDPVFTRMRDTRRIDGTEPWHPVEQPVSQPLEPFQCTEHDFSIRMPGSDSVSSGICRICEQTNFTISMNEESAVPRILAHLWPVSQASDKIFHQFCNSGITDPEIAQRVEEANYRTFGIMSRSNHDVRSCECHLCSTNRKALEAAILPHLDESLIKAIALCQSLLPQIQNAVGAANEAAMRIAAGIYSLDEEQAKTLVGHITDCNAFNSGPSLSDTIEQAIGAATYSIATGTDSRQPNGQQWLFRASWLYHGINVPPEHAHIAASAAKDARSINEELISPAWTTEMRQIFPDLEPGTDDLRAFAIAADITTITTLFEHIRYQATGICSSSNSWPPPHAACAKQILDHGVWTPSPLTQPFQEGRGYHAELDPYRRPDDWDQFNTPDAETCRKAGP